MPGFGNEAVTFDLLQVFDHHGHRVLTVPFIRTSTDRSWQAVFIHGHLGGIALRTVHPGNQAPVVRYGQIGNTSLPLIFLSPGDDGPAGQNVGQKISPEMDSGRIRTDRIF